MNTNYNTFKNEQLKTAETVTDMVQYKANNQVVSYYEYIKSELANFMSWYLSDYEDRTNKETVEEFDSLFENYLAGDSDITFIEQEEN